MRFLDALLAAKSDKRNIVIPDIKCFSPKEGDLMKGRNPVEYAKLLCEAGAPVLSVVTEEKEFHGSLDMLKGIAEAVDVPILRKDFIHTREDLIATRDAGASAILLMCSCLEQDELIYLYNEALALGLDPFVETHKKEDFAIVRQLSAKLVGINNRDILVLERDDGDVSNTLSLADCAPKDAFLVTESSIKNPSQVRAAIGAGADAALVGTAILNAEHTKAFYRMMCRKVCLKICGLMNRQDIEKCVELGVEKIGIVTDYPVYVPWNNDAQTAAKLRVFIPQGYTACMITGGDNEKIIALADIVKPDMIQLHYKENLRQADELSQAVKKLGIGIIKTVPTTDEDCMEQFGTCELSEILSLLSDSGIEEILVDPRHGSNAASTDLKLDAEFSKQVVQQSGKPVILAGGISADNLSEIIGETGCQAVDIMNGSEDEPGRKNSGKISRIIEILENLE